LRNQHHDARRRVDGERLARLRLFQLDYEARIAEESAVKAKTQDLVADLEREELELIQRLQSVQLAEAVATEELQRVKVEGLVKISGRSGKAESRGASVVSENKSLAN
jgi:hypothetical protein